MQDFSRHYFSRSRAAGLSLVEMAVVMGIVSLALVPVIKMVGGPSTGEGSVERVTAIRSKEVLLANSRVEEVLANDFKTFECNANRTANPNFDPDSVLPNLGATEVRQFNMCQDNTYNKPIFYRWTVKRVADVAMKNELYRAVLNVFSEASSTTPILTMSTSIFRNNGAVEATLDKVGVMVALDRSGSMRGAKYEFGRSGFSPDLSTDAINDRLSTPYMFYRYDKSRYTGNSNWGVNWVNSDVPAGTNGAPRVILDKWNNTELDMSIGQAYYPAPLTWPDFSDPNSQTSYNEKFPYGNSTKTDPSWLPGPAVSRSILGTGDCSSLDVLNIWGTNANNGDRNIRHTFLPEARLDGNLPFGRRNSIQKLCSVKDTLLNPWSLSMDKYMSRFEASRTGILSMLLTLEKSPTVLNSVDLGFIPWSDVPDTDHKVSLESASYIANRSDVIGKRYQNNRNMFLWINRGDPRDKNSALTVPTGGTTNIYKGLETARTELLTNPYGRRIIVLVTDGYPNPNSGNNSSSSLRTYAKNTLGDNQTDPNKRITLFTVGLIDADEDLMRDMADSTPDGQSFVTKDTSELKDIFESISFQIQKLALIGTTKRYNLDL